MFLLSPSLQGAKYWDGRALGGHTMLGGAGTTAPAVSMPSAQAWMIKCPPDNSESKKHT